MSRYVNYRGRIVPASLLEPFIIKPGECTHCGGTGEIAETIDEERYDEMVPCFMCQVFCKACDKHVKKTGHQCKGAA